MFTISLYSLTLWLFNFWFFFCIVNNHADCSGRQRYALGKWLEFLESWQQYCHHYFVFMVKPIFGHISWISHRYVKKTWSIGREHHRQYIKYILRDSRLQDNGCRIKVSCNFLILYLEKEKRFAISQFSQFFSWKCKFENEAIFQSYLEYISNNCKFFYYRNEQVFRFQSPKTVWKFSENNVSWQLHPLKNRLD